MYSGTARRRPIDMFLSSYVADGAATVPMGYGDLAVNL